MVNEETSIFTQFTTVWYRDVSPGTLRVHSCDRSVVDCEEGKSAGVKFMVNKHINCVLYYEFTLSYSVTPIYPTIAVIYQHRPSCLSLICCQISCGRREQVPNASGQGSPSFVLEQYQSALRLRWWLSVALMRRDRWQSSDRKKIQVPGPLSTT